MSWIFVDAEIRANAGQYFDRYSGVERVVPAKRVVVVVGCVDSSQILLNSTSRLFLGGLGNASDMLRRYLCEQVRIDVHGFAPQLLGVASRNDDGTSMGRVRRFRCIGAARVAGGPIRPSRCWIAGTACAKPQTCLSLMERPFQQRRRKPDAHDHGVELAGHGQSGRTDPPP